MVGMNNMIIWIIPIDYTNELDRESSLQSVLDGLFKYLERAREKDNKNILSILVHMKSLSPYKGRIFII